MIRNNLNITNCYNAVNEVMIVHDFQNDHKNPKLIHYVNEILKMTSTHISNR